MARMTKEEAALLEAIAGSESAGDWNVIYGGSRFNDYSKHPAKFVTITSGPNKGKKSSAAGKYQITKTTYDRVAPKLGITDFSPESQQQIALYLAREKYGSGLAEDLANGNAADVAAKLAGIWTSLPGGIEATTNGSSFTQSYADALDAPRPPGSIPDVATAIDTAPPRPMPSRPFGNSRQLSPLEALLPDQAMYGVRPGGPAPEATIAPDFAVGDLTSTVPWWQAGQYNDKTGNWDSPTFGEALQTLRMPKVPAQPQGPQGRRPPPRQPVPAPSFNETRREQNTTYRPPPPAAAAPPPLPRARPEPPLGFDPLPAPPPLVPQSTTPLRVDPVGAGPGSFGTFTGLLNDMVGTTPSAPPKMPDTTPSGRPMWFTSKAPGTQQQPPPSTPALDPAAMELDRMRLNGYRDIQEMGPSLPPGGSSVAPPPPPTTPLIARKVQTIPIDPMTNLEIPPVLAPGPRALPPVPMTPSPMLRATAPMAGPPPIPRTPPSALRRSPSTGAIGNNYTVRQGDTLGGLARSSGLTLDRILAMNPQITDPDRIRAGDTIRMGTLVPTNEVLPGSNAPLYRRTDPPPIPLGSNLRPPARRSGPNVVDEVGQLRYHG